MYNQMSFVGPMTGFVGRISFEGSSCGEISWELTLGSLRSVRFAWKPTLGWVCLGACDWLGSLGILHLVRFTLIAFAWLLLLRLLLLGRFCSQLGIGIAEQLPHRIGDVAVAVLLASVLLGAAVLSLGSAPPVCVLRRWTWRLRRTQRTAAATTTARLLRTGFRHARRRKVRSTRSSSMLPPSTDKEAASVLRAFWLMCRPFPCYQRRRPLRGHARP